MPRRRAPPPTKSADMVKDYLDLINAKQAKRGRALRYDIFRRAGSGPQTDRMIKRLKGWGFIEGNDKDGYRKTKRGEEMHKMLQQRELIGILTRDLTGPRIGPW